MRYVRAAKSLTTTILPFQGLLFLLAGCGTPTDAHQPKQAPSARGGAPAAWISQEEFVIFGGMLPITGDTHAFDASVNKWTQLTPAEKGATPPARCHHTLVPSGNDVGIILFGGFSFSRRFNDLWRFDPDGTRWIELSPTGSIPSPRCLQAAAFIPGRNELLIYGGVSGSGVAAGDYFQDTHIYDVPTNEWAKIDASGPGRLRGAISFYSSSDNAVYVWGGKQVDFFPTTLWRFDPDGRYWESVTTTGESPLGREDPIWFWDDRHSVLYVFSGRNDTLPFELLADGFVLELSTSTWKSVRMGSGPSPRWRATVVHDANTDLGLMFGGWRDFGGGEALNDTWSFDTTTGDWTLLVSGTTN